MFLSMVPCLAIFCIGISETYRHPLRFTRKGGSVTFEQVHNILRTRAPTHFTYDLIFLIIYAGHCSFLCALDADGAQPMPGLEVYNELPLHGAAEALLDTSLSAEVLGFNLFHFDSIRCEAFATWEFSESVVYIFSNKKLGCSKPQFTRSRASPPARDGLLGTMRSRHIERNSPSHPPPRTRE